MEQKSFKNKIVNFYNKTFRLVVINDETLEEEGFLKVNNLKQDDKSVETYVSDTILEVTLANPILPGNSSVFTMDFKGF